MKSMLPLSLLFAAILSATAVFAANPLELVIDDSGQIKIQTDTLPTLEARTAVYDVSTGEWKSTRIVSKAPLAQGVEVVRQETRGYPDGTEVPHTVKAKIADKTVEVAASWAPTGNPQGFSRVDLWLPEDLAQDVVLTVGEKEVYSPGENKVIVSCENIAPLVAKRKSNGEFLFQLNGDYMSVTPAYYANNTGLTLRLLNVPSDVGAHIGDKTALNWTLSFKQP